MNFSNITTGLQNCRIEKLLEFFLNSWMPISKKIYEVPGKFLFFEIDPDSMIILNSQMNFFILSANLKMNATKRNIHEEFYVVLISRKIIVYWALVIFLNYPGIFHMVTVMVKMFLVTPKWNAAEVPCFRVMFLFLCMVLHFHNFLNCWYKKDVIRSGTVS